GPMTTPTPSSSRATLKKCHHGERVERFATEKKNKKCRTNPICDRDFPAFSRLFPKRGLKFGMRK
ncbi:MAG: hypothetical protein ACREQI_00085, partial [Candidatus Binataceae bacterium]